MAKMIDVVCSFCGSGFQRPVARVNETAKFGWKTFCSSECRAASKVSSHETTCANCGGPIKVQRSLWDKSKSGKHFCSSSCAATHNNKGKQHTQESKERTRTMLLAYHARSGRQSVTKNCVACGQPFRVVHTRSNTMCCSKACSQVYQHGSLPLTKEEVLTSIHSLAQAIGCTPSSKRVGRKIVSAARRFFKTWNKAVTEAGFIPNTQWMARKNLRCKDGHKADSISEMLVDNWFQEQGIRHEREKRYPESNHTCDFYLPELDVWVEYFGFWHEHPEYDATVKEKFRMAAQGGFRLVGIAPDMLYPKNKLALDLFTGV